MWSLNDLVQSYVTGNLSVCDERDITYGLYDELLNLLRDKQINVQKAMTTILPRINSKVVLPNDIANLTRKVKKHLDAGRSTQDVIVSLLPQENDTDEISKYCSKAGITVANLNSDNVLDIPSDFLTNQLVYDLETYRRKKNFPLSEAVKWHNKIFLKDPNYNVTEASIGMKWKRNYSKVQMLKSKHKTYDLVQHLEAAHIPPMRAKTAKEHLIDTLADPPLEQINSSDVPLLAMAEFQGAVMGKYIQKLEHKVAKGKKENKKLKETLNVVTSERDQLDLTEKGKGYEVKRLQTELKKSEENLLKEKERVSFLNPRNVKRREETKIRQLNKLQEKSDVLKQQLQRKEHQVKKLQNEVDNSEAKIEKRIHEQSEAHAKELKEQNTEHIKQIVSLESEIEVEKHLKKNAQKNSSKWKMAFKKRNFDSGTDIEVTELKTRLDDMENENQELKEKIENFLRQKPIETFKDRRYSDNVREVYHYLTAQGISCHKVAPVIRKVIIKLTNEKIERLPMKSLTATMPVEADLLSKMHVGAILENEPNSTLHIDGTTKNFLSTAHLMLQQVPLANH